MSGSTPKIYVIDDEPSERFPVWTRGNVGEVFAEALSPLTWDLLGFNAYDLGWRDALVKIGAFTQDEFGPQDHMCGSFGGYVYINVSASRVLAVRLPGMTPEEMDRSFFGNHDAPPYVPHPADENEARTAAASAWLSQLLTDLDLSFVDADKAAVDAEAGSRGDLSKFSDAELIQRARRFTSDTRHYFGNHLYLLYGATVVASVVSRFCAAVGKPELDTDIMGGLGDVDSAETSNALWALSRLVRTSEVLTRQFDQGTHGLLDRLEGETDDGSAEFVTRWTEFIEQHGAYGTNLWELRSPTFGTEPKMGLDMVDLLRGSEDAVASADRWAQFADRREEAAREVSALLIDNAEMLAQFQGAVNNAKRILPSRERAKGSAVKCVHEARLALRELGGRLVYRGAAASDDVLFVVDAELEDYAKDPGSFSVIVAQRRAQLKQLQQVAPPFVFAGDRPPLDAYKPRGGISGLELETGTILEGIGASSGVYQGTARNVRSIDDAGTVQDGDVLVAEITDSAWGPLFLVAGAVVVETGSPISHAAIVARELGIPAVVSVPDIVGRIPDGSLVTVDGGAGKVIIERAGSQ